MKKYYFRVDGGNIYSTATGHISRCLKLANYISGRENSQIYFIMRNYKEGVDLVNKKYKVILLDVSEDINSEISLLKTVITNDCYFVCDIRKIDNQYIAEIKKNCLKFVLFDDLGRKDIEPDILINPTPFCYADYKQNDYPKTILLLGEKFFLVSDTLVKRAYLRDFNKEKYNIMASFGGADPCNITEFFLKDIVPQLNRHNISIILGPAYSRKKEIIKKYGVIKNIKFYTNVSPLGDIFLDNDIAFVSGGDTCIESCVSGLATFIISSIYYEKQIAELLHKKKMVYFIADIEDIKNNNVNKNYLKILKEDKMLLRRFYNRTRGLVDGRGQERIYNILVGKANECTYR